MCTEAIARPSEHATTPTRATGATRTCGRTNVHAIGFVVLAIAMVGACEHTRAAPPAPAAVAPTRGAAGDTDVRVMLSDLASSKACGMIRDGFQGLRSAEHPDVVTGVLWIRRCEISNEGTHITFHVSGNGWLWVDQTKSKAGGTFSVHQYVRFSIAATMRGGLDVFYDPALHVLTLWFTPDRAPAVEFKTIGDIDVDNEGVWSSVVGAVGSVFATSPTGQAHSEATTEGTQDLSAQFAKGIAVAIDLCSGLRRISIGHPPKGEMGLADIGETQRVPAEIQPGGVMIIGPWNAEAGMTLQAEASQGAARLTLVCAKQADKLAAEYITGRITSDVPVLGEIDVRAKKVSLGIKRATCPVVVVASPLGNEPTRFSWERPTAEIARAMGGPMVNCRKSQ